MAIIKSGTLGKNIKTNVVDTLMDTGFSRKEALAILPSLFLYLFRSFNQVTLKEHAAVVNPEVNMFPFLSKVPLMGDLTLNDKVCLYAIFKGENPGVKANSYVKKVLENERFAKHLKGLSAFPAYTIQQVQALERRAICNSEISTYMGKFIFRKMSFITKNYGVTKEDLVESMQERAIHNLRINYPTWNAHGDMLAMAKSAIANAGHNIINFYAASKRAKINVNNEAIEVSLDAMKDLAGDSYEYTAFIYSDVFEKAKAEQETRLSITSLLRKVENRPGVYAFLKILAGHHDEGFSEFLGKCNRDFADDVSFEKLKTRACQYFGIDTQRVDSVLKSLR